VKEKFGTREKLIDAILQLENRGKDTGLRQKLSEWPVPRLFDAYKAASKRKAPAAAPAGASAAPKGASNNAGKPAPKVAAKKAAKKVATKATR